MENEASQLTEPTTFWGTIAYMFKTDAFSAGLWIVGILLVIVFVVRWAKPTLQWGRNVLSFGGGKSKNMSGESYAAKFMATIKIWTEFKERESRKLKREAPDHQLNFGIKKLDELNDMYKMHVIKLLRERVGDYTVHVADHHEYRKFEMALADINRHITTDLRHMITDNHFDDKPEEEFQRYIKAKTQMAENKYRTLFNRYYYGEFLLLEDFEKMVGETPYLEETIRTIIVGARGIIREIKAELCEQEKEALDIIEEMRNSLEAIK